MWPNQQKTLHIVFSVLVLLHAAHSKSFPWTYEVVSTPKKYRCLIEIEKTSYVHSKLTYTYFMSISFTVIATHLVPDTAKPL